MAKLPAKVRFNFCLARTNSVEPVARGILAVLWQYLLQHDRTVNFERDFRGKSL